MTNIYDQFDAAFKQISAYAVMRDGDLVARISIKFPRDGAGRLYAYVHWLGAPMVRGHANGYGYDKRSAACAVAARKMTVKQGIDPLSSEMTNHIEFMRALEKDGGEYFYDALRHAGFTVYQVI